MKTLPALLAFLPFLAACKPPATEPSALLAELAALRRDLAEVKKAHSPNLEAVEAMDDLAREVKALRQKVANPAPPPAPAAGPALAPGGPPIRTGDLAGGVGGTQAGINDLYWVLGRIQVGGEERLVLSLYRAVGKGFELDGVRMLNADLQIIEWNQNKPRVKDILEELQKLRK